jgi:hypothetical protein
MSEIHQYLEKKDVHLRTITKILGTAPTVDVYTGHVATKIREHSDYSEEEAEARGVEEAETIDHIEGKGLTGFHSGEHGLFLYEYMINGFLKSAIESITEAGVIPKKIPAYKKWIDRLIHIEPRRIYLGKTEPDGILERPLRAQTRQGDRVTVTASEFLEPPLDIKFTVGVMKNSKGLNWDALMAAFDYAAIVGLAQWRGSGGYGRCEVISITDHVS